VRALRERILRQEPIDVKKAARTTATSGLVYPLRAAATRIGRLSDNDIVLDDANVSRHHAVIIDTGTSFVITDLRSANGVHVPTGSASAIASSRSRSRRANMDDLHNWSLQ
jgi:SARP family transcriptional regulator, regulator of embCAB operon